MTKLQNYIEAIPDDRVLLDTGEQIFNRDQFLKYINCEWTSSFVGTTVAISVKKIDLAISIMVALDGVADGIFLVPHGISSAECMKLFYKLDSPLKVISDQDLRSDQCDDTFEVIIAEQLQNEIKNQSNLVISKKTRWILSTSGTAGEPKLASHSLESLIRTIKINFEVGRSSVWGLLYGYTRFAGLQVLLQSLISGSLLIAVDTKEDIAAQLRFLIDKKVTHLSATPTLWRRLIMTLNVKQLNLQQITLGGEISDQTTLSALQSIFPSARITHIYASTEAGVGFSVNDGKEGFPRTLIENSPKGIKLKVSNGELKIKNTHVMANYIGSSDKFRDSKGFVATGDRIELKNDRYVFKGRISGVINVGGNKVYPEKVEQVLCRHQLVNLAYVFGKNSPITGQIVAANVMPSVTGFDHDTLRKELLMFCTNYLEKHEIPVIIFFYLISTPVYLENFQESNML